MLSGLTVGNSITIPGDEIKKAIEKLWEQGLFENIKITATKIQGDVIFLNIDLRERPRLSKFSFKGVKKGEVDKLRDEIKLTRGDVVTENVIMRTTNIIKKHFTKKGYLNTEVIISQVKDTSKENNMILEIAIKKHSKSKNQ